MTTQSVLPSADTPTMDGAGDPSVELSFDKVSAAVYVHCQAGMNRSALVVARVLMARGMSGRAAVDLVRERRKGSLSDEYADWLLANPIHQTIPERSTT